MATKTRGPYKPIDYDLAEKLSRLQCNNDEIAMVMDVNPRTLERNKKYVEIHRKGLDSGKAGLRRLQWAQAEKGNVTMLIWLGKQYLGQSDKVEQAVTGKGGQPIQVEVKHLTDEQLEQIIIKGSPAIPISTN